MPRQKKKLAQKVGRNFWHKRATAGSAVPDLSLPGGVLFFWKRMVLQRLEEAPGGRVVLWVHRPSNSGESAFADHLKATYRYGVFGVIISSFKTESHMAHKWAEIFTQYEPFVRGEKMGENFHPLWDVHNG